jgi:hypothetical protein
MRLGAKSTTDSYLKLDVRRWSREGVLRAGYFSGRQWTRNGETVASIQVWGAQDRVTLRHRFQSRRGEWSDEQYTVWIVRTLCHLGGSRAWFVCPVVGCGRRVAILYGRRVFACRHCQQLAYTSSRKNSEDRACQRAAKLRARLGWEAGILRGAGGKPKWMRWPTFERLVAQHDAISTQLVGAIRKRFEFRPY